MRRGGANDYTSSLNSGYELNHEPKHRGKALGQNFRSMHWANAVGKSPVEAEAKGGGDGLGGAD